MAFCVQESSLHPTMKSCDVSIFSFSRNQTPFEPITEQYCIRASDASILEASILEAKAICMKLDTVKTLLCGVL